MSEKKSAERDAIIGYLLQMLDSAASTLTKQKRRELYSYVQQYYPDAFGSFSSFSRKLNAGRKKRSVYKEAPTHNLDVLFRMDCKQCVTEAMGDEDEELPGLPEGGEISDVPSPPEDTVSEVQTQFSESIGGGLGLDEQWLEGFKRPAELFKDWSDTVTSFRRHLDDLQATRSQFRSDRNDRTSANMSESVAPIEKEPARQDTQAHHDDKEMWQDHLQQPQDGDMLSHRETIRPQPSAAQLPMRATPVLEEEDLAQLEKELADREQRVAEREKVCEQEYGRLQSEKQRIFELQQEQARKEEDFLERERVVEAKSTAIARNIDSIEDPAVVDVISQLDSRLDALRDQRDSLKMQESLLQGRQHDVEEKKRRVMEMVESMEQKHEELLERNRNLQQEGEQLAAHIDSLQQTRQSLDDTVEERQHELERLLRSQDEWIQTKEQLLEEISEKSARIRNKENEIESMLEDIRNKQEKLAHDKKHMKEAYAQKYEQLEKMWEERMQSFEKIVAQRNKEFDEKEQGLRERERKLSDALDDLERKGGDLAEEADYVEQRKRAIEEYEQKVNEKFRQVDVYSEHLASNKESLERAIEDLTARFDREMREKTHEFDMERQRLLDQEKRLREHIAQLEKNEHQLSQKRSSLDQYQKSLEQKEQQLEQRHTTVDRTQMMIDSRLEELHKIEDELNQKIEKVALEAEAPPAISLRTTAAPKKAQRIPASEGRKRMQRGPDQFDEDVPQPVQGTDARKRIHILADLADDVIDVDLKRAQKIYEIIRRLYRQLPAEEKVDVKASMLGLHRKLSRRLRRDAPVEVEA